MTALLALLALAPASGDIPARHSRAAFAHAMAQVRVDSTQAQVKRLLGEPDDRWPPHDSSRYVVAGDEAWCYGTNGHHTLPTLGYVMFRNGKVLYALGGYGQPPSPEVVSETELVQGLRGMYRRQSRGSGWTTDPLRLIQVANLLIPKGQTKALAILGEYARIGGEGIGEESWLFWLVRAMFVSKLPGGTFPVPRIGAISPPPPTDLRKWPTYPVLMVDDVPICFFLGASLGGQPEPFSGYLRDHQKDWTIRRSLLRPPDDPFLSYQKLIASPRWPFPKGHREDTRDEMEGQALREILKLVRSAYRPAYFRSVRDDAIAADFDRYHREFLAVGCRWDADKQVYSRKDGAVLSKPRRRISDRTVGLPWPQRCPQSGIFPSLLGTR